MNAPPLTPTISTDPSTLSLLADILLLRAGINTNNVLLGATLLGCAAGVVGAFAMLRKRALMTDALAHATLPGIAAAFLLADALGYTAKSLPLLLIGAAVTGVLGVFGVHLIVTRTRLRQDAAIGIVLSVFFGVGVVFLSAVPLLTTTPAGGLNSFIYGQAAALQRAEVWTIGAIGAATTLTAFALHKPLALLCFNDSFAQSIGWPTRKLDLALMGLIVLVTIAGLQSVGLIMVVALLIIPPAAARFWTDRLGVMLIIGMLLGGLTGYCGAAISAFVPNTPAGAVIVLTGGVFFLFSMLFAPRRGVFAETFRRVRLHLRIASDHMLESLHEHHEAHPHSQGLTLHTLAHDRGLGLLHTRAVLALLRAFGLVSLASTGITPTPTGLQHGARIARNHRLWAEYLITHADLAPTHVNWSVDQVEHVLGEDLVAELERSMHQRNGSPVDPSLAGGPA